MGVTAEGIAEGKLIIFSDGLDVEIQGSSPNGVDIEKIYRHFHGRVLRSEEHTSELQSLMRISYAVFCLKNKTQNINSFQSTIHITICSVKHITLACNIVY